MKRVPIKYGRTRAASLHFEYGLVCMLVLLSLCPEGKSQSQSDAQRLDSASVHVTHVLGFEDTRHNVTGDLKIQGATLQFQRDGILTAQVTLSSIQDVFIEDADKQVGGTAMTLGKAAVPYGGGRVVSLFAHKKYDIVTLEYRDDRGGFHGAIFQFSKGQAQAFKTNLLASGAHASSSEGRGARQSPTEVKHENK